VACPNGDCINLPSEMRQPTNPPWQAAERDKPLAPLGALVASRAVL
jgi:hypothetical protein